MKEFTFALVRKQSMTEFPKQPSEHCDQARALKIVKIQKRCETCKLLVEKEKLISVQENEDETNYDENSFLSSVGAFI